MHRRSSPQFGGQTEYAAQYLGPLPHMANTETFLGGQPQTLAIIRHLHEKPVVIFHQFHVQFGAIGVFHRIHRGLLNDSIHIQFKVRGIPPIVRNIGVKIASQSVTRPLTAEGPNRGNDPQQIQRGGMQASGHGFDVFHDFLESFRHVMAVLGQLRIREPHSDAVSRQVSAKQLL